MLAITASNSLPASTAPTLQPATPEHALLATAAAATIRELARTPNEEASEIVAEMSVGLNRTVALAAPKIFQLNHRLGEATVVKLLVLLLKCFVDSVRVPDKLGPADIIEVADTLAQTYTHDSIKDILLALKEARTSGTIFYQALDASQIYAIINTYFDKKSTWLESQHHDRKAQGGSLEHSAVAQLRQFGPQLTQHLQLRIAPDHPNADQLRRKLSLTAARERRGLITPAQAAQSRADVAAANVRKARADWQPGPEAQAAINARHRQDDQALADKYCVRS